MFGGACACHQTWTAPERATRVLLGTTTGHVLPAIARTAQSLRLAVDSAPGLLDLVDERNGRRLDRLFNRLARELTAAETEAVRIATDPPRDGAALAAALLSAPTLAVELARRGVTAEVDVLTEAEFFSVYQPIVSLGDRTVRGHEALLRGSAHGREVGGGDLFFLAEAAGWLAPLDRIGRESAVVGAAGWLGDADLYINVNPASIHRPQICLAGTERAVHDAGLASSQIVVEVVESPAAADRGHLLSVVEHYRSLGWRVAVNGGGAGWASPALLAAVRPEVVKLDKALVQLLPKEGPKAAVRAVVQLAHDQGATVVAEGVETERLADEVIELGVDLGQGWLFGRPERRAAPAPDELVSV